MSQPPIEIKLTADADLRPEPVEGPTETPSAASAALLARAQEEDADAFCELVQEHEERLFRQALTVCGDAALAEDLAQETLLIAWKRIGQFDGRCRLFTWLCGILINLARNAARRKLPTPISALSHEGRTAADDSLAALPDPAGSPAELLQREERAAAVQRCLHRLPAKHREVVYLRFFVDDSLEGIANALGCSVGTIKSRLFNALEKLNAMPEMSRLAVLNAS